MLIRTTAYGEKRSIQNPNIPVGNEDMKIYYKIYFETQTISMMKSREKIVHITGGTMQTGNIMGKGNMKEEVVEKNCRMNLKNEETTSANK